MSCKNTTCRNSLQCQDAEVEVSLEAVHRGSGDPTTGKSVCSSASNYLVEHTASAFLAHHPTAKQDITSAVCVPDVFTASECMSIICEAQVVGLERAKIFRNGKSVKSYGRTCSAVWLPRKPSREWIYQRVVNSSLSTNDQNFRFQIDDIQTLQVLEYRAFQRFFWHYDTFIDSRRKLTAVFNLSDPKDYIGGGFRIIGEIYNKWWLRQRGAGVWFPSFVRHCAKAPIWGRRWVLVAWLLGEEFK